jgi:hypothetical protein
VRDIQDIIRQVGKLQLQYFPIHVFPLLSLIFLEQSAKVPYTGKTRYIGTFESRETAALAYEIVREQLELGTIQRTLDPNAV